MDETTFNFKTIGEIPNRIDSISKCNLSDHIILFIQTLRIQSTWFRADSVVSTQEHNRIVSDESRAANGRLKIRRARDSQRRISNRKK